MSSAKIVKLYANVKSKEIFDHTESHVLNVALAVFLTKKYPFLTF